MRQDFDNLIEYKEVSILKAEPEKCISVRLPES
jgi:hypothetical protein